MFHLCARHETVIDGDAHLPVLDELDPEQSFDVRTQTTPAQAGAYSDILMTTRLPAASMSHKGPNDKSMGKFQGAMMPVTLHLRSALSRCGASN
jgi:hypothetical protein